MKLNAMLVVALVAGLLIPGLSFAGAPRCEPGKPCPFLAKLAGEWRGLAETRNDHVVPESLKIVVRIDVDGKVTGRIGEWKLVDGTIKPTHDRDRKAMQAEFIISGAAEGMKTLAGGKTLVNIGLNFENANSANGTVKGYASRKKSEKVIWQTWNLTHFNRLPGK